MDLPLKFKVLKISFYVWDCLYVLHFRTMNAINFAIDYIHTNKQRLPLILSLIYFIGYSGSIKIKIVVFACIGYQNNIGIRYLMLYTVVLGDVPLILFYISLLLSLH